MKISLRLVVFALGVLSLGCNGHDEQGLSDDDPIQQLKVWLEESPTQREVLKSLSFASINLTKSQAQVATNLLYEDSQTSLRKEFEQQWTDRVLQIDGKVMPFFYQLFGDEPADGRSLFISMHGGGGAPARVNDQQWDNQKHLYDKTMQGLEGMYLAPRAPTNTWNLWHQDHIDAFFNLIIQMAVAKENVNPNKVYLMGYSAGGDGVYQLAPRMADRWAAAAMMAGHPNETSPLGLKNLPFALHMGGEDDAYDRNKIAREWKIKLDELAASAPGTYIHQVQVHEGLGHWMQLKDAVALPWMKNYQRNPIPESVMWKQDDVHHERFYWLGVPEDLIETGGEISVRYDAQSNEIDILSNYSPTLQIGLNDAMLNLDQPVTVKYQDEIIYQDTVVRTILNLYGSLSCCGDQYLAFPSMLSVENNSKVTEERR